jgi:glycosyltransferase involved in cell wall biosynthesis
MKILNISQNAHITGGSDIYWDSLTCLLQKQGHKVYPFSSFDKSKIPMNSIIPNVAKEYFPNTIDFNKRDIATLIRYIYNKNSKDALNNYINKICDKIDLAHLHIYYGKLTASILSVLTKKKIPIVQTLHEYKLVCPTYKMFDGREVCYACKNNKFYNCFLKKCNRDNLMRSMLSTMESYVSLLNGNQLKIDKFITVSQFQKFEIIKMGFNKKKLTTVYNYIDTKEYTNFNKCDGYFVYFGRIEKVKGIITLLKAMKIVVDNRPDARLKLVGSGEFFKTSQCYAKSLDLRCVEFLGFKNKSEVNYIVGKAIANVVPSIWFETFGLTILEAFALGVPSIVSDIGGMPELVNDGVDGFIVAPGDSRSLAKRMIDLYDDVLLSKKMGKIGREKIISHFSPESHFQQLQKIYHEVM